MKIVSIRLMFFNIWDSIYVVSLKNIEKIIFWLRIKFFSLLFHDLKYGHRKILRTYDVIHQMVVHICVYLKKILEKINFSLYYSIMDKEKIQRYGAKIKKKSVCKNLPCFTGRGGGVKVLRWPVVRFSNLIYIIIILLLSLTI